MYLVRSISDVEFSDAKLVTPHMLTEDPAKALKVARTIFNNPGRRSVEVFNLSPEKLYTPDNQCLYEINWKNYWFDEWERIEKFYGDFETITSLLTL